VDGFTLSQVKSAAVNSVSQGPAIWTEDDDGPNVSLYHFGAFSSSSAANTLQNFTYNIYSGCDISQGQTSCGPFTAAGWYQSNTYGVQYPGHEVWTNWSASDAHQLITVIVPKNIGASGVGSRTQYQLSDFHGNGFSGFSLHSPDGNLYFANAMSGLLQTKIQTSASLNPNAAIVDTTQTSGSSILVFKGTTQPLKGVSLGGSKVFVNGVRVKSATSATDFMFERAGSQWGTTDISIPTTFKWLPAQNGNSIVPIWNE
jgi:hypothetical protein